MMLHEDDVGIADGGCDARAFAVVEREAVIIAVHCRAAVELQRGLAGPDQGITLGHRQRRGVGHVGVEGDLRARQALVHLGMDVERGRLGRALAVEHVAVEIADQELGRRQLAEGVAVWIDQEEIVMAGQHGREMVADALLKTIARGHAEAGREVLARGADRVGGEIRPVRAERRRCG